MTQGTDTRAIFITGAASGIGRETARLFHRRGFAVGLFDRDVGGLEDLATELGERVLHRALDVTNETRYRNCLAEFGSRFGRLDVLFNCAGIMRMGPFSEVDLAQHLATIDVNAKGVVIGTWLALDLLRKTPSSCVLTMCSASAIYGVPELSSYSASKFFVRGLTEALSLELEPYDIRVTDLMPSYVGTSMVSSQTYQAGSLKNLGADLTPEAVAELAWKAAHGRRVHWLPGMLVKTMSYASGMLPFLARPTMRYLNR